MLIILRRKANDATNIILQIIMIIVVCSNTNTAIDWYVKQCSTITISCLFFGTTVFIDIISCRVR